MNDKDKATLEAVASTIIDQGELSEETIKIIREALNKTDESFFMSLNNLIKEQKGEEDEQKHRRN